MGNHMILATAGTSLLRHWSDLVHDPSAIMRAMSELEPTHLRTGAEIGSMERLFAQEGIDPAGATLHFFVSDTPDGRTMGEILAGYYAKRNIGADFTVVLGLTHDDPDTFARQGLRNLVRAMSQTVGKHRHDHEILINATGGYKAQISFAAIIGQVLGLPVFYLFEKFTHIIRLDPLPVDFDQNLWLSNYDFFTTASEMGVMAQGQFPVKEVNAKILRLLDQEQVDGQTVYSLSPILELMHQGFLMRWPDKACAPPDSAVPPGQRLKLNPREQGHAPSGARDAALKLCQLPFVEQVRDIEFANTARTYLTSRTDGTDPSVAFVAYSDGDHAVIYRVRTTAANAAQVSYVRHELARAATLF